MSWQRRIATISCAALFSIGCTYGLHSCISSAWSFDQTGLNMWLDANDINATGNPANNPAQLSSVSLWKDKSGHGNNAFQAPVGDPDNPEPDAASFPGSSGGVTHAEIIGPLPPAPVYEKTRNVTPSGLPAVRFNTCNDAPQFPGCNVSPPTYPTQTALMTNYYAPPDPSMVQYNLANYSGSPNTPPAAVPDLTVVAIVRPT